MPTDYSVDPAKQLVKSRAWGVLTEQESLEHYRTLSAEPGFAPTFRQLCDMRQVEEIDMSSDAIRCLAQESIFAPGAKRAFVAQSDAHFGLARMLQIFADLEGSKVGVFRTIAEAEAWLGLEPGQGE